MNPHGDTAFSSTMSPHLVVRAHKQQRGAPPSPCLCRGFQTNMDWDKERGDAFPYYVYGAACAEVDVDCLSGAHKVQRPRVTPSRTQGLSQLVLASDPASSSRSS